MSNELVDLIQTLEQDHRRLVSEVRDLEQWVTGKKGSTGPTFWSRVVETLDRIRTIVKSHGELETAKLFPALREATREDSDWQLGMTEMQDELILKEVGRLCDLVSRTPMGISLPELKESATHLARWITEHVTIEEKFLFPKISKRATPPRNTPGG